MNAIMSKLYVIIFAYGAWTAYNNFVSHGEDLERLSSQVPVLNAKINKAKKEKKQVRAYLKDIEAAKQNIEIVAKEVESLQRKLPETIQDTENLSLIKNIATGLNIKDIYMSPGIEENKGFYFTKRYEFTATGTYLQFLIFFEKIGASERLLNIKSFEFKKSEVKQRGRFQLINVKVVVEAYRYNPNHKEDRGIQKIESDFKNGNSKSKNKKKRKS